MTLTHKYSSLWYNTNTTFIYSKILRLNIAHKVKIHNTTTHRVLISSTLACILHKESVHNWKYVITSVTILHSSLAKRKIVHSSHESIRWMMNTRGVVQTCVGILAPWCEALGCWALGNKSCCERLPRGEASSHRVSSWGGRVGPCQTCPAREDELLKVLQTHSLRWVRGGRGRGGRGS